MRVSQEAGTDDVEDSEKVLVEPPCACSESEFAVSQKAKNEVTDKNRSCLGKASAGKGAAGLQAQPGPRASFPCDSGE